MKPLLPFVQGKLKCGSFSQTKNKTVRGLSFTFALVLVKAIKDKSTIRLCSTAKQRGVILNY